MRSRTAWSASANASSCRPTGLGCVAGTMAVPSDICMFGSLMMRFRSRWRLRTAASARITFSSVVPTPLSARISSTSGASPALTRTLARASCRRASSYCCLRTSSSRQAR